MRLQVAGCMSKICRKSRQESSCLTCFYTTGPKRAGCIGDGTIGHVCLYLTVSGIHLKYFAPSPMTVKKGGGVPLATPRRDA